LRWIFSDIPIPNISTNAKPKKNQPQILNSKSSIDIGYICTQKMNQMRAWWALTPFVWQRTAKVKFGFFGCMEML
jgi:hypothetical protein